MRIAYDFYDFDGDGKICVDDVMNMIRSLKPSDWLLMEDCQVLIKQLKLKNYKDINLYKRDKTSMKRLINFNLRSDSRNGSLLNFKDILTKNNEGNIFINFIEKIMILHN